jgi:uncharacterized phage infection (PIP) family protein YhgE
LVEIMRRSIGFFLAMLPTLFLASCGGESPQSLQEKTTQLCTNLARFNTAVASLKSISPSSTVGDLRKAQDRVKATFNELKTSAKQVQTAKVDDLERAHNNLEKTIQNIPNTTTLSQANTMVSTQVAAVEAAQAKLKSGLNCP